MLSSWYRSFILRTSLVESRVGRAWHPRRAVPSGGSSLWRPSFPEIYVMDMKDTKGYEGYQACEGYEGHKGYGGSKGMRWRRRKRRILTKTSVKKVASELASNAIYRCCCSRCCCFVVVVVVVVSGCQKSRPAACVLQGGHTIQVRIAQTGCC